MSKIAQDKIIELLRAIDSPTISNAIEKFQVRNQTEGYASSALICRFPELPPMVGYAVTCIVDTTSPEPTGPNRLTDFYDAVASAPKPAVAVMQNQCPSRLRSCMVGDMVCTSLQKLGVAGMVTDGGVRDLSGIRKRAPGFQVFSGGLVVSHACLPTCRPAPRSPSADFPFGPAIYFTEMRAVWCQSSRTSWKRCWSRRSWC